MTIRFCSCCLAIYRQDFQRCPLDGGTLVVGANDPWIGLTVGSNYVVEELLGEGAMARVYRAHHRNFRDRRYAIKILIGDLAASAQMRARFALEAENAKRLSHPNVVGVCDFGATDHGIDYMAMELVEGSTLGAILRRGPMDPKRVITLARQIAEGLDHAHGRGVIHRDLKPDNIMVLAERELEIARIADFGLALSKDKDTRLTTTGVVCTPAYAAPEQLRGDAIDLRVDLYALGVTMFEMLSGGILPFAGDVDASVTCKLTNQAPSVLMVAPNVPPALVSIVGRLLAAEPGRRPHSARTVICALDQALSAPRVELRTEQIAPLSVATDTAPGTKSSRKPTANLRSGMREVLESEPHPVVRIDSLLPMRQRRVHRAAVQLFACGMTLAGVLAWADMRDPTPVRAEPALVSAEQQAPVVSELEQPFVPEENLVPADPVETLVPPPALTLRPDDCDGSDSLSSSPAIEPIVVAHRIAEREPARREVRRSAVRNTKSAAHARDVANDADAAKPARAGAANAADATNDATNGATNGAPGTADAAQATKTADAPVQPTKADDAIKPGDAPSAADPSKPADTPKPSTDTAPDKPKDDASGEHPAQQPGDSPRGSDPVAPHLGDEKMP